MKCNAVPKPVTVEPSTRGGRAPFGLRRIANGARAAAILLAMATVAMTGVVSCTTASVATPVEGCVCDASGRCSGDACYMPTAESESESESEFFG